MSVYHVAGPVTVSWDDTDLGVSKNGCTINITTFWTPLTNDYAGDVPTDLIFNGKTVEVTFVGLDTSKLKSAITATNTNLTIGKTAYGNALGKALKITEANETFIWEADCVILPDPQTLQLRATQETQFPITFIVVPDDNDQLFKTTPFQPTQE